MKRFLGLPVTEGLPRTVDNLHALALLHFPPVRLPQITYDVLPLAAFLALVAAAIGAYMFYAGNKVTCLLYV